METRWALVAEEIRRAVGEQTFSVWFKDLRSVGESDLRIELLAPDGLTCQTLQEQYEPVLAASVKKVIGPEASVEVRPPAQPVEPADAAAVRPTDHFLYSLNPQYSFENFIVGPSNRLAHAASVAVAGAPGRAYNPLFIHSCVGLGKTHLVQAICHDILARKGQAKIRYLSCESFINDFIHALERGDLARFRGAYRQLDVLVIDDVQFLSKKTHTQEEFFHTFNTLYNAGKQIVLTSDSPPRDLMALEERLTSRFKWGLVVPIEAPEYETRMAIIRRKARLRGANIPDEVLDYVARNVDTNIRELEGAIIKLSGYAALSGRLIDMDLARDALDYRETIEKTISMESILSVVIKQFNTKLSDLQSKRRTQSVVLPRQICMYFARQMTNHSLEEIGGFFGGRDHTTVLYAERKIANQLKKNTRLSILVNELKSHISQNQQERQKR